MKLMKDMNFNCLLHVFHALHVFLSKNSPSSAFMFLLSKIFSPILLIPSKKTAVRSTKLD
jgi:hypothetical protein